MPRKTRKYREKDKLFGRKEIFKTTVIMYVGSAILRPLLLLMYIAHHSYPRNGVRE